MSFLAKLELDGEEMSVLQCSFRFSQDIDISGKPSSRPRGGIVTLVLESTGSTMLFDWMINPSQIKEGLITFYRRDTSSRLKTLKFIDAYCIDYYEIYDHLGAFPMQVELKVSALELHLNDSEYKNNWPV
ncbi:MAG: hypothetical protein KF746_22375 [Chitinophagaceae bacterium]|nr:hypothetical protein [Chitinophagaceae bacterium]